MYPKSYLSKEINRIMDMIGGQRVLPSYINIHLHVIGTLVTEISGIHLFEKKSRTPEGVPERMLYLQDMNFNNDESIYSIDLQEYEIIFSEYFHHPNLWKISDLVEIEDKVKSYQDMNELARICRNVEDRIWTFYNIAKKPRHGKVGTLRPKEKQKQVHIPVFDIFVASIYSGREKKQTLLLEKELRKFEKFKSSPVFDYTPAMYKVAEMMAEVEAKGQDPAIVWQEFFYKIIHHQLVEKPLYFDGHELATGGSGEYMKKVFEDKFKG